MWRHISINSTRLQPFPTPQAQPANAEFQCCKVQASEACRFSDEALASCSGYSRAGLVGRKPIDPLATQLLLENNWPRVPVEQSGEASHVPPSEAPFLKGQTRRAQIGIAGDFRAQAESSHAQFQSAPLARD